MALKEDNTVHSTTKTLINTVGKVREVVNALLHYNPATTPLTDTHIRWLLNSPLESVIKNILVFEMVYAALKEKVKQKSLHKLLEKIGLKEFSKLYHEWQLKRKQAEEAKSDMSDFILEFEQYRVQPTPAIVPKHQLAQLTLRLADLQLSLKLVIDEIKTLFTRHQLLLNNLIILNQSHVNTVRSLATRSGVALLPEQVMIVLPEAHTAYHEALSPLDQIRALGRLIDDNTSLNNAAIQISRFLNSTALNTAFKSYEDGLGMINLELTMVNETLIACQMRQTDLIAQIQDVESMIDQIQAQSQNTVANSPFAQAPAPQFSASDVQDLLSSFRPHAGNSSESDEEVDPFRLTKAAPAA